jgi:hypothetical protein
LHSLLCVRVCFVASIVVMALLTLCVGDALYGYVCFALEKAVFKTLDFHSRMVLCLILWLFLQGDRGENQVVNQTLGLALNSLAEKSYPVPPWIGNKKTRECVEFFSW